MKNISRATALGEVVVVQRRRVTVPGEAGLVDDSVDLVGGHADLGDLDGDVEHFSGELERRQVKWQRCIATLTAQTVLARCCSSSVSDTIMLEPRDDRSDSGIPEH